MTRAVICGGRFYGDVPNHTSPFEREDAKALAMAQRVKLENTLDRAVTNLGVTEVACGRCPTGADKHAIAWAKRRGVPMKTYKADWQVHGDAAGPIRNRFMLEDFQPDVVVAFPGGRGTEDCKRQARAMGIRVEEIPT